MRRYPFKVMLFFVLDDPIQTFFFFEECL